MKKNVSYKLFHFNTFSNLGGNCTTLSVKSLSPSPTVQRTITISNNWGELLERMTQALFNYTPNTYTQNTTVYTNKKVNSFPSSSIS